MGLHENPALGMCTQAVADTWALAASMPALDDFTVARVR
jgi:hypothetical protein